MIYGFFKKIVLAIAFAALVMPLSRVSAEATCAMLTFSDNTRFYKIGGAGMLSDLVLEKLVTSGKISFKETKPLAGESVTQLYDEDGKMYKIINQCRATGNYNPVFEGRQFDTAYARSVDLAVEGDIVEPELVQQIGRESGVTYLIQGTIDNYGTGKGVDGLGTASMVATMLTGIPIFGLSSDESILGVSCTMRVIEAETGKVVWCKKMYEQASVTSVDMGKLSVGTDEMNSKMYYDAMDKVAEKLSATFLEDLQMHKLPIDMGV